MAKITALRVQVPTTDDVTTAQVKAALKAIIRAAGTLTLALPEGQAPSDLMDPPTIRWDAADVVQGAETRAQKPRTARSAG